MACSNNVVRAGLTPKAIDKETLIDMLTYEYVMLCELYNITLFLFLFLFLSLNYYNTQMWSC